MHSVRASVSRPIEKVLSQEQVREGDSLQRTKPKRTTGIRNGRGTQVIKADLPIKAKTYSEIVKITTASTMNFLQLTYRLKSIYHDI